MTLFFVGVDGGATRTRAVIVDAQGREAGRAEAPGAVASELDPRTAAGAVAGAVRAAAATAAVELPMSALWAGLAGAGREPSRAAVEAVLRAGGLATSVHVGTDAEAAFAAAFGAGAGILLIAGTGSMALARDPAGSEIRVGGWGARLGDEGSAYWIASQALGCIARAEDGRAQPTALRDRLLKHLGISVAALIPWVERAEKGKIAALTPLVLSAAQDGDAVAAAIRADALLALRDHVLAVLDRLGDRAEGLAITLWGGLVDADGPLHGPLLALLEPMGLPIRTGPLDPALGAAHLALGAVAGGRR